MPQMAFVQGMAVAALVATLLVVCAIPVGAHLGARTGMIVLRVSLIGVVVAFAALAAWGASTGDLARFNARMGAGTWIQMGAFFGIVYMTGYRFVASYLADKSAKPANAPGDGDSATPEGGTDA